MVSPAQAFKILRIADAALQDPGEIRLFTELLDFDPRPVDPIRDPAAHGFFDLTPIAAGDPAARQALNDWIARIPVSRTRRGLPDRTALFQDTIELVHRLADSYRVYLGRAALVEDHEQVPLLNAWCDHHRTLGCTHATTLVTLPHGRVEFDDRLARVLVETWQGFGELCCNSDVILGRPPSPDESRHLAYLCVSPR